jgi:hypothetical protein
VDAIRNCKIEPVLLVSIEATMPMAACGVVGNMTGLRRSQKYELN